MNKGVEEMTRRGRPNGALRALGYARTDGIPRRSFYVAIIVGTVLNVINQWQALLGLTHFDLLKLILTYIVPYCVATYGAVSYRLRTDRDAV